MSIVNAGFRITSSDEFSFGIVVNGTIEVGGIEDDFTVVVTDINENQNFPAYSLSKFHFSMSREDGPLSAVGSDVLRLHERRIANAAIDSIRSWKPGFDTVRHVEHD